MINNHHSFLIRQTVDKHLPGCKIILFGSRARNEEDESSDYDLLIITNRAFSVRDQVSMLTKLDTALVKEAKIPIDLLLQTEDEVKQKKELPGNIIRSIIKEGIAI